VKKIFKIFMDFDGTITQQDVGDEIFRKFADDEKVNDIIDKLLNDRMSSRDCWIELCDAVTSVDSNELNELIDNILLDSTFINFKNYCDEEEIEIYVLSDGFDYYINRIFDKNDIKRVKVYSNHLEVVNNKMIPGFPYYDESSFSSANCKRNHVINHSSDDDFTIYIGDGNSDKEAVEYCDFIFAKDDLLRYCEMKRITFFPFNNLDDVIERIKVLKSKRRLKKRLQAQLKRQQVYITE
jgi:2,3-diketo-5-methylthio-1-phosphopentane phosphatase